MGFLKELRYKLLGDWKRNYIDYFTMKLFFRICKKILVNLGLAITAIDGLNSRGVSS